MNLRPDQVGWETIPPDMDPAIYKRALLTPASGRSIDVPDGVLRLPWSPGASIAWPAEGTINEAVVLGVFERIEDIVGFWRDLYRACAHGAYVHLQAPYWSHVDAVGDPTRRRGISERHLAYLSASGRLHLRDDPYEDGVALAAFTGIDFDTIRMVHLAEPEWDGRGDADRERALLHLLNVARRLEVTLLCHKPSRAAGDV